MTISIPRELAGQRYISLATFRKSGEVVRTPVWFGEADGRLYVMSRSDSGKFKRIRNNPKVRVAPCTFRGKLTGPEFDGMATILPEQDRRHARQTINRKYWAARIPLIWARTDGYLEIAVL
ncbi:MAG: PPOX class F420-dependent oxidoreductase [Acidobacteriales bacterium]|nr:PPOX class F420-dependent oxidoreductase [Terriglobales bacterium]